MADDRTLRGDPRRRRLWPVVLAWAITAIGGLLLFVGNWLAQEGECGFFDGGPEPGEEGYCNADGLHLAVAALPAAILVVGTVVAVRSRWVIPFLVAVPVAVAVAFTVPFTFTGPACEGDTLVVQSEAAARDAVAGRLNLRGKASDEVCRRLGRPASVESRDGQEAWTYYPYRQATPRAVVLFEDGRVQSVRAETGAPRP